ncbi:MAG: hypothetical protein KDA24_15150 [Deltaproteobacteria bacterium]|nr:hypothetical protein [Deltaproteobacteria bacterium]
MPRRLSFLLLALLLLIPFSFAAECGETIEDEDEAIGEHDQQPSKKAPSKGPNPTD